MSPFWLFLFVVIAATAAFPDRKRGLTELTSICADAAIIDGSALKDDFVSPHFPKVYNGFVTLILVPLRNLWFKIAESERSQLLDSAFAENLNVTVIGGYNYFIYKHEGNKIVGGSNTKLPRLMVARRVTQGNTINANQHVVANTFTSESCVL